MKNVNYKLVVVIGSIFLAGMVSISVIAGTRKDLKGSIAGVQADISACDYNESGEEIANLNTEISELEAQLAQVQKDLAEAEENNDALGILRAKTVIESCMRELEQKRKALLESTLQHDNSLYYVENREALVASEQEQAAYQSYRNELQMHLCDEKMSYLSALSQELKKKIEIEREKVRLGYGIQLSVDEIITEYENVQIQIEDTHTEQEFQRVSMKKNGNETGIMLEEHLGELGVDYVNGFLNHSVQLKYYDSQIAAYTNYINGSGGEGVEKISKQLELAELNRQEYQEELELYVKGMMRNYTKLRNHVRELENEKALMKKRIDYQKELFQKGRVLETEVKELETEQLRLEYERKSSIADAMAIKYILEHHVEGQTL